MAVAVAPEEASVGAGAGRAGEQQQQTRAVDSEAVTENPNHFVHGHGWLPKAGCTLCDACRRRNDPEGWAWAREQVRNSWARERAAEAAAPAEASASAAGGGVDDQEVAGDPGADAADDPEVAAAAAASPLAKVAREEKEKGRER